SGCHRIRMHFRMICQQCITRTGVPELCIMIRDAYHSAPEIALKSQPASVAGTTMLRIVQMDTEIARKLSAIAPILVKYFEVAPSRAFRGRFHKTCHAYIARKALPTGSYF